MKYRHRISSASTSVRKISLKVLITVRGCVACKNWYRVIITYAASLMMSLTAQLLTCCAALTDAFSKSHWPISSRQTLRRGHHCSLNTDVVYPAVTLTGYARLRVVMEFHRGAARAACRRSCDINGKLGSIPIGLGSFKQDGSIRRRPSLRQGPKPKPKWVSCGFSRTVLACLLAWRRHISPSLPAYPITYNDNYAAKIRMVVGITVSWFCAVLIRSYTEDHFFLSLLILFRLIKVVCGCVFSRTCLSRWLAWRHRISPRSGYYRSDVDTLLRRRFLRDICLRRPDRKYFECLVARDRGRRFGGHATVASTPALLLRCLHSFSKKKNK